jgi:hypothetical protein
VEMGGKAILHCSQSKLDDGCEKRIVGFSRSFKRFEALLNVRHMEGSLGALAIKMSHRTWYIHFAIKSLVGIGSIYWA